MDFKCLSNWKIKTTQQPFYPTEIRCIGNDEKNCAIIVCAAHTVNTFIFRNFSEDVRNNNAPHKSYLHKTFFPDRIKNITVGQSESAILLENGRIQYFSSPKKLMTVEYLHGVKSVCSTTQQRNGFAIIKTSMDGRDFFCEFHPDAFQDNNHSYNDRPEIQRSQINISFDRIPELQNTWHRSCFKIKELVFSNPMDDRVENQFLKTLFPDDVENISAAAISSGTGSWYYFLSIDNSFCSIHFFNNNDTTQHLVNPITICTTKIIDFWAATGSASINGGSEYILLLMENGTVEILYQSCSGNGGGENQFIIDKKILYLGNKIQAYEYFDGVLILSDGLTVEYGTIEFDKDAKEFKFNKKTVGVPGIVALLYLPKFKLILLVSENCQFYSISIQRDSKNNWIEIDDDVQQQLANVKHHLIELTDIYDNLLAQREQQKHVLNVIKLKRTDSTTKHIQSGNSREINKQHRFVAVCSVVTQRSSIQYRRRRLPQQQQQHDDSKTNTINISSSSTVYDPNKSFFVTIQIFETVKYANVFGTSLWSLCCRWLNDKHENIHANIKLKKGQLSSVQPITLTLHLQQKHLPYFHMDVSTVVVVQRVGSNEQQQNQLSSVYINFPVHITEQPDYCEIMNVFLSSHQIDQYSITGIGDKNLVCTIPLPPLPFDDELLLFKNEEIEKDLEKKTITVLPGAKLGNKTTIYTIQLLGKILTAIHCSTEQTLRLITKDHNLMHLFKKHVHRKIEMKLMGQENQAHVASVTVSAAALKEYYVSC